MAKFKCDNLLCTKFNKEVEFMQYKSMIKNSNPVYMDKQFNQLVCGECGEPLEFIQPEFNGYPQIITQTFNSLSNSDKKKVLLKREKAHSKTNKSVKEYKEAVNRGEIKP